MKQLGFYLDQTRCTGCYTCAVACKDWHDIDAGPVNFMRVRAIEEGRFPDLFVAYLALPCCHCKNPPCAGACPADAILKRESDGIVTVDQEKCPGNLECKSACLNACPWGVPQFGPEENATMRKCDLCLERMEQGMRPVCVEACPMYALEAGPLEELMDEYGDCREAEGFGHRKKISPSIIFKPKNPNRKKWGH